jgi:hypothetical protein
MVKPTKKSADWNMRHANDGTRPQRLIWRFDPKLFYLGTTYVL